VHYKNFLGLLDAYRQWQGREQVGVVVVGEAWSRAEQQYLQTAGLVDRVRLFSELEDAALCRLYNTALALVFPSLEEGFGIPLLEAMACGCPVVASHIPSTQEVAADCPIYFDPTRPETLLPALDQARLEGRASQRAQAGLERVKLFSWETTARQTLEVYRHVCDPAGTAAGMGGGHD
jgi:glycosyltransferase involved in cell wall biosynthesis